MATRRGNRDRQRGRPTVRTVTPAPTTPAPRSVRQTTLRRERAESQTRNAGMATGRNEAFRTQMTPAMRMPPRTVAQTTPRSVRNTDPVTEPAPDKNDRCKGRPSRTRGNGGSRPYVPWCQK